MPITTGTLNRIASTMLTKLGALVEAATYHAKSTPTATPVTHALAQVEWEQYSLHAIDLGLVLREDRRLRIPTAVVSWTPTLYDEVTRADGTQWRVMDAPPGGLVRPFYLLQVRRVS